jgi:hypothetical protein
MGFWLGEREFKDSVWVAGAMDGLLSGRKGVSRICVGGFGCGWAFEWVKGGLKTLCR